MAQRNFQWQQDETKWTKIIIPGGTVDPNQSTVIQIPEDLQHSEVIIARNQNTSGQSGGGGGSGGGGRPCPSSFSGNQTVNFTQQDNFQPPFETSGGPPPPAPPSFNNQNQNKADVPAPAPVSGGEDVGEGNMVLLTTPKEAEILQFVKECDRERARLLVMPINKKMRLMDQMEYIETGVVNKDLKEFQETRRKLVFDLQSIYATLPNVKQNVKGISVGKT